MIANLDVYKVFKFSVKILTCTVKIASHSYERISHTNRINHTKGYCVSSHTNELITFTNDTVCHTDHMLSHTNEILSRKNEIAVGKTFLAMSQR